MVGAYGLVAPVPRGVKVAAKAGGLCEGFTGHGGRVGIAQAPGGQRPRVAGTDARHPRPTE